MGRLIVYLGGAKSGKTRLALARTETFSAPRLYLATAEARDEEMEVRIRRHQAERGPGWRTVECPLDPASHLAGPDGGLAAMLDCVTLWLSNLLGAGRDQEEILAEVDRLIAAARERPGPVIVVSNEVGGGIVPANELARLFRDLAGSVNQRLAAAADEAVLAVAGLELRLK